MERILECENMDKCGKTKRYIKREYRDIKLTREVERIETPTVLLNSYRRIEIGNPTQDGGCSCERD